MTITTVNLHRDRPRRQCDLFPHVLEEAHLRHLLCSRFLCLVLEQLVLFVPKHAVQCASNSLSQQSSWTPLL